LDSSQPSAHAAVAGLPATQRQVSAYVSIRQHTSAYVSIRQHTSAYVSILCQHTSAVRACSCCCVSICTCVPVSKYFSTSKESIRSYLRDSVALVAGIHGPKQRGGWHAAAPSRGLPAYVSIRASVVLIHTPSARNACTGSSAYAALSY